MCNSRACCTRLRWFLLPNLSDAAGPGRDEAGVNSGDTIACMSLGDSGRYLGLLLLAAGCAHSPRQVAPVPHTLEPATSLPDFDAWFQPSTVRPFERRTISLGSTQVPTPRSADQASRPAPTPDASPIDHSRPVWPGAMRVWYYSPPSYYRLGAYPTRVPTDHDGSPTRRGGTPRVAGDWPNVPSYGPPMLSDRSGSGWPR